MPNFLIRDLVRTAICAVGLTLACAAAQTQPADKAAPDPKILRYAFLIAESNFDPAQITDLYSRTVVNGIFEAPLEFEFLAKPARMRTNTAVAMPEVSADFTTFTFRIKPGIHFADDPAFKGKKRELVAEDYVYSIKRHYDPRWKSGNLYIFENAKIVGLSELRKKLIEDKKPFDYDAPVEGIKALDRYTLQIKLGSPGPRFLYNMADASMTGALAREVVSSTATASVNTRWARGPSGSRNGSAARVSCWLRTPAIARCCGTSPHRLTTPGCKRWPSRCKASGCRSWTKCTSPSSKSRSRAG